MARVTLSSKHQITLPVEMVRGLNLKPGDKLVAELVGDHIVLLPQPGSWTDYFRGSMKGVYGSTVEEIDQYIAEERASPERWEWQQEFYDLEASDPDLRGIVDHLRGCPNHTMPESDLWRINRINGKRIEEALKKLVEHGGVRRIPAPPGIGAYKWQYRLVREFSMSQPAQGQ